MWRWWLSLLWSTTAWAQWQVGTEAIPETAIFTPQFNLSIQTTPAAPEQWQFQPFAADLDGYLPIFINVMELPLLPDPETALFLENTFSQQVASINHQIGEYQAELYTLLNDTYSSDRDIRRTQAIISQLRTERDRLSIEHLIKLRQVQDDLRLEELLPPFNRSASNPVP